MACLLKLTQRANTGVKLCLKLWGKGEGLRRVSPLVRASKISVVEDTLRKTYWIATRYGKFTIVCDYLLVLCE